MKAETTIQFLYDFFPDDCYSRTKALELIFLTSDNGMKPINGELVFAYCAFTDRWQPKHEVEKAMPTPICILNRKKQAVLECFEIPMFKDDGCYLDNPPPLNEDWQKLHREAMELFKEVDLDV